MTEIIIQAFKFDELSDAAKEKVRDWYREGNLDHDWWDTVYDDAVEIGKLMGIEISVKEKGSPAIWFDMSARRCCYEGRLIVANLKDAVQRIKDHVGPNNKWLFQLAQQAENLHALMVTEHTTRRLTDNYEECEASILEDWAIECDSARFLTYPQIDDVTYSFGVELSAFVPDFASWIYSRLEAEHDWLQSDECIDESIRANEYLFDESGSII